MATTLCYRTGGPHEGDPCASCAEQEAHLAATRAHPDVIACQAALDVARRLHFEARDQPDRERMRVQRIYEAVADLERDVFYQTYNPEGYAAHRARADAEAEAQRQEQLAIYRRARRNGGKVQS